jgi:NADH-quinone oxidoreductase chain G
MHGPATSPICDQGGECDLQDQAMIYGSDRGRFYEYKRSLEDKNGGPLIKTIMTRCIHCTRCIRFATEIAGVEVLGTSGRGKGMEVGTYISSLFSSELSGNVIDLCPVGALTSKPYSYRTRPWELKSIESIDVLDAVGTNTRIDIRGSELMRILPRSNDEVNQQWISDKTRFSYDGLKCQRLQYPMIKHCGPYGTAYLTVSWKAVFNTVVQKTSKIKPNKIAGVIGQFVDQETILFFKNFMNKLGVSKLYAMATERPQRGWGSAHFMNLDFRSNYLTALINSPGSRSEAARSQSEGAVLLVGCNPRYEASLLNVRLLTAPARRGPIASVACAMSLRTGPSDHLGNGTKTLFQLAQGNHGWVQKILTPEVDVRATLGLSALQRQDGYSLPQVADSILSSREHCEDAALCALARGSYRARSRSERNGRALHSAALGPFGPRFARAKQPRNGIRSSLLHAYASTPGAFDLGFYPGKNVGSRSEPHPQAHQTEQKLECLYLLGADYKWRPEVESVATNGPITIYQGHHGDYGAQQADIILPSAAPAEKDGIYVNTEGRVQQSQAAIQSEGASDGPHDWKIIRALWSLQDSLAQNALPKGRRACLFGLDSLCASGTVGAISNKAWVRDSQTDDGSARSAAAPQGNRRVLGS